MDSDVLIRKCTAISLKSEEENMINFTWKMNAKGAKIAAHCLLGKTQWGVSREGFRAAMQ